MYTTAFTTEIATQHIQDMRREAGIRRLAKLAQLSTTRTNRTRNDVSWPTTSRWHIASAH